MSYYAAKMLQTKQSNVDYQIINNVTDDLAISYFFYKMNIPLSDLGSNFFCENKFDKNAIIYRNKRNLRFVDVFAIRSIYENILDKKIEK